MLELDSGRVKSRPVSSVLDGCQKNLHEDVARTRLQALRARRRSEPGQLTPVLLEVSSSYANVPNLLLTKCSPKKCNAKVLLYMLGFSEPVIRACTT